MLLDDAVYPHFNIYPKVARYVPKMTVSVRLPGAYPVLDICKIVPPRYGCCLCPPQIPLSILT